MDQLVPVLLLGARVLAAAGSPPARDGGRTLGDSSSGRR